MAVSGKRAAEQLHVADDRGVTKEALERPAVMICGRVRRDADRYRWLVLFRALGAWGFDVCPDCRRLAALPDDRRIAAQAERASAKAAKIAKLAARKAAARDAELVVVREAVAIARSDAHAALDAWETDRRFLEPGPYGIDARTGEILSTSISTRTLLVAALNAYKLENPKARGDRLWLYELVKPGTGSPRCRFCRECLGASRSTKLDISDEPAVFVHTTTCALRYLAGVTASSDSDFTKEACMGA